MTSEQRSCRSECVTRKYLLSLGLTDEQLVVLFREQYTKAVVIADDDEPATQSRRRQVFNAVMRKAYSEGS